MAKEIPHSEPVELAAKLAALPPEADVHITISVGDIREEDTYAWTDWCFPKEDAGIFLCRANEVFGFEARRIVSAALPLKPR